VAEFIGSPKITMVEARVGEGGRIHVGGHMLAIEAGRQPGSSVVIGIRPEAFTLVAPGGQGELLAGRVRLVEHLGSDLYLHLDAEGQVEPVIARLDAERAPHVATGEQVHLAVRAERVLVFAPDGQRIRTQADRRSSAAVVDAKVAARRGQAR
jgi:multiple sugar transport system ATP-binding protein